MGGLARALFAFLALSSASCTPSELARDQDSHTLVRTSSASAPSSRPVTDASERWATFTRSPSPLTEGDVREASLASACGEPDAALQKVARDLAITRAKGLGAPDPDAVTWMLRSAGEPHLSPRTLAASGQAPLDDDVLRSKLAGLRGSSTRCAVGIARTAHGGEMVVGVAVDALADLSPLPSRARAGEWLSLEARVHVPVHAAKLVLLGSRGLPRTVPTSLDEKNGIVRARFALERPGAFTVQLVGDLENGPRPLLEARVFADHEPPQAPETDVAPGEEPEGEGNAHEALARMITGARNAEGVTPLVRDRALDGLARAHAERMREGRTVAHDLGEGDLRARFQAEGYTGKVVGENVAHARSVQLAHRTLYASASHRLNLLRADYTHMGIGIAEAPDGSVYVCEVFAAK